ncbi:MAG: YiiX/YebB-like N1pC/P60 family cysteine hydrolase [Verrucomicrobiaceae bacterium]
MLRTPIFTLLLTLQSYGFGLFKQIHHPLYEQLHSGDIVFQDTGGEQGQAVKAATGSRYTHCGVVFNQNGKLYVLEAIQPVSVVPLNVWKARSAVFHARRLKNPEAINPVSFAKAIKWGSQQLGKDYDSLFKWGDDELYCSELVWKIYHRSTGLKLCPTKSFQSYFLDDPAVQRIIRRRYGAHAALPKDEPVVAPSDLAESTLLAEVPRRRKKR